MAYEGTSLVIDNGSGICKAGFGGDDAPRVRFPSIIGEIKAFAGQSPSGLKRKEYYIGSEAESRRTGLNIKRPIERGMIVDFDAMEKVWHQLFDEELRASSDNCAILLADPPLNSKANREKTTQMMFEFFCTPALYLANQAVCSLYASGRTTGLVIDSGDSITNIVPVYESHYLAHATNSIQLGGRDLTIHLIHLLNESGGVKLQNLYDQPIVNQIKEKYAYVSGDFMQELSSPQESKPPDSYQLPDGQTILIGKERFRCAEPLFRPSLVELESSGIHECLMQSMQSCDESLRAQLPANILLSGGNTMFTGIDDRLKKELAALLPSGTKITVIAPSNRNLSTWVGGSIMTCLSNFNKVWMSKEEYDEFGVNIVHRKCF